MDGVADGWADNGWTGRNPVEIEWKTDGVMDCWPKGIGQMRKSTVFNRKLMGINGWVMVTKIGMCVHKTSKS